MKKLIPAVIICFMLGACSFHIEKRHYFKGYHISISHNRGQQVKLVNKNKLQQSRYDVILPIIPKHTTAYPSCQYPILKTNNFDSGNRNDVYLANNIPDKNLPLKKNRNNSYNQQHLTKKTGVYSNDPVSNTKSKSRSDGLFMILSGAFVAAFAMVFKPLVSHTKKIGYWALNNRKIARGLHFVAHCGVASCGYFLGQRCYDAGLESSELTTYGLAGAATVITALYPHRKTKSGFFKNTYFKQKMFSMFMVITGFLMFVNIGNRVASESMSFPLINKVFNLSSQSAQVFQMPITANANETPEDDHRSVNILLTVLTAIVSLILSVLIIAGSCSLSCSGQESLSIGVLVIGLPLVVMLSIFIIKSIWKDELNERKKSKPVEAPKVY